LILIISNISLITTFILIELNILIKLSIIIIINIILPILIKPKNPTLTQSDRILYSGELLFGEGHPGENKLDLVFEMNDVPTIDELKNKVYQNILDNRFYSVWSGQTFWDITYTRINKLDEEYHFRDILCDD